MSAFPSNFGSTSFEDLLSGFGDNGSGGSSNTIGGLRQKARNLGYQTQPGSPNAIGRLGKYRTTTPIGQFASSGGPNNNNPFGNIPPILLAALGRDTTAMQQAADEQYARNNAQIAGMEGLTNTIAPRLEGNAQGIAALLAALSGQALGIGQQQLNDFNASANALYGDVSGGVDQIAKDVRGQILPGLQKVDQGIAASNKDVDAGYGLADQAIAGFQQGMAEFKDRTAQDASTIASGIRRNAMSAMNMVRNGTNPDGSPMTPEQKMQATVALQRSVGEQVQEAITPYFSKYNEAKVGLEANLASLRMNAAGLHLQGAGIKSQNEALRLSGIQTALQGEGLIMEGEKLKAQVGTTLTGQLLQAQEGQRQMVELASNLSQFSANITQSAILNAINLEAQGRTSTAQFVQQNPKSVVSWFQGLLALYSISQGGPQAPGGGGGNTTPQGGGAGRNTYQPFNFSGGNGYQPIGAGGSATSGYSRPPGQTQPNNSNGSPPGSVGPPAPR